MSATPFIERPDRKTLHELLKLSYTGAQIAFTILSATSIGDTVYCSQKGGRQRSNGWSKSFFLGNKVVINYDFRYGAKKSGQSGHSFRSYGFFQ